LMVIFSDSPLIDKLTRRLAPAGPRQFVAIDFDGRSVRIVHARRTGKSTRIETLYTNPMPVGLDGEDTEAMGGFLADSLEDFARNTKAGLGRHGVLMSVPRRKAVLKPLVLPPGTKPAETASMVRFQVEKDLPFNGNEAVIDFTISSHLDPAESAHNGEQETEGISVLVGAVSGEVVEHYRQIAQAAGVRLRRLGLRPYANMKCVDACIRRSEDETVAAIHITGDETEINVLKGGSLAFCRSAVIDIPPEEQQQAPAVNAVVREIVRSIHSYGSVQHHGDITAVLIAGGTGIEPQVLTQIEERLELHCELLAPAAALNLPDRRDASAYAAAIGLAIAHQGRDLPFDFLNPKRPAPKRNIRKMRAAAIAAGVAAVLLALFLLRSSYLGDKGRTLAERRIREKELKDMTRGADALSKRTEAVEAWIGARTRWLDHLMYISQVAPGCEDLYVQTSINTGADGKIRFSVYGKSHETLKKFKARLAEAGYDPQVKGTNPSDRRDYTHSEEIVLTVKPGMTVDLARHKHVPRPADDDSANVLKSSRYRGSRYNGSRYRGFRR